MNPSEFAESRVANIDSILFTIREQIEQLMQTEERLVAERDMWAGRLATQPTLTLIQGGLHD